jgi:hypothetical protein
MGRSLRFAIPSIVLATVALVSQTPASSSTRPTARSLRPELRAIPSPVACGRCWSPALEVSWQWQLAKPPSGAHLLDVRMYDVDGFEATERLVAKMHARRIKAVCYFSAGSWESWRPDASDFPAAVLGRSNGWPGEKWLDVRRLDILRPIMKARLDMCAAKRFDAVEFDNVDGYQNHTGFPLTAHQQLRYDVFLANQAHVRGLSAFLKNDLDQVGALIPYFDAALNEQCFQYHECGRLSAFIDAGKPVFGVEYKLDPVTFCPKANAQEFNFLKKRLKLDAWRVPCRGA